jgi:hypothetical protein
METVAEGVGMVWGRIKGTDSIAPPFCHPPLLVSLCEPKCRQGQACWRSSLAAKSLGNIAKRVSSPNFEIDLFAEKHIPHNQKRSMPLRMGASGPLHTIILAPAFSQRHSAQVFMKLFLRLLLVLILLLAKPLVGQELLREVRPPAMDRRPPSVDFFEAPRDEAMEFSEEHMPPPEAFLRPTRPKIDLIDRSPFRLSHTWVSSEPLKDGSGSVALQNLSAELAYPLLIEPEGIWLATSRVEQINIQSEGVLPVSGIAMPGELWDIRFGTMRFKTLANGWRVGGFLNFGSAGDRPFEEARDLTLSTLGMVTVPYRNRDAWNFSLFYSPTSQLAVPLPGIAYVWRPSPRLEAEIGLPASLTYRPTDSFSLQARYTPVTDFQVEARQWLDESWSVYGRFEISSDTFWLSERIDNNLRFFRFEQRLRTGVTKQLPWGFRADAGIAYIFNRKFLLSDSFDLSAPDLLAVDPGIAGSLQISWTR